MFTRLAGWLAYYILAGWPIFVDESFPVGVRIAFFAEIITSSLVTLPCSQCAVSQSQPQGSSKDVGFSKGFPGDAISAPRRHGVFVFVWAELARFRMCVQCVARLQLFGSRQSSSVRLYCTSRTSTDHRIELPPALAVRSSGLLILKPSLSGVRARSLQKNGAPHSCTHGQGGSGKKIEPRNTCHLQGRGGLLCREIHDTKPPPGLETIQVIHCFVLFYST